MRVAIGGEAEQLHLEPRLAAQFLPGAEVAQREAVTADLAVVEEDAEVPRARFRARVEGAQQQGERGGEADHGRRAGPGKNALVVAM